MKNHAGRCHCGAVEFEALISRELKIWAEVVRQAGVKVE